ncbi:MAG: lysophospholipid acyltransferase family protein [Arcobacteraceae bacterium]|jgi:1-acyl-sn-glycerol-3-phosphate acyltransferase|nr:1-acyl-sn-glycerol-3-phosphate acyltransferase [Arcobacteraceae bacterium]MDY0364235.1 lysophospholipid acyltransferase family protein [Arcobacteraceae bacterium]
MKKILAKIKGILYILQFAITVTVMILFMYIFKSKNHYFRKKWSSMQMKLLGIRIEEMGKLDLNAQLLMINHQSMLDIVIFEYLHQKNIAWIAKQEIEKLPLFGHIIKAPNMISVDREDKAGLIKLLKDAGDRLESNRPIAIFPEGTRGDGKKLLPFKAGAKMIANKYNLLVQPIVVIGSKDRLDSVKLTATSGSVKIIYLDSFVAIKDKDWFEDTQKKMNEVFDNYNI